MQEWLQSGRDDHVFIKREIRGGNGAMRVLNLRLRQFLDIMENPCGERVMHEIILHYEPACQFIDFEIKLPTISRAECEQILQDALRDIRELMEVEYQIKGAAEIVLESTRMPEKFSAHVIWPDVWFATPGDIGRFLQPITQKYHRDGHYYVDPSLYRDHALAQMRTAYSWKCDAPTRILEPRVGPLNFQWAFFKRCCVSTTITRPDFMKAGLPPPLTGRYLTKGKRQAFQRSPGSTVDAARAYAHAERVLEYLSICYGTFAAPRIVIKESGGWEAHLPAGLYCALRGGAHSINTMYAHSDDLRRVYFVCTDPKCKGRVYLEENFTLVI